MNPTWFSKSEAGQSEAKRIEVARETERAKIASQLKALETQQGPAAEAANKSVAEAQTTFAGIEPMYHAAFAALQATRRERFRLSDKQGRELEQLRRQLAELADPAVDAAIECVRGRIGEIQRTASPVTPAEARHVETELRDLTVARVALQSLRSSPLDAPGVVLELQRITRGLPLVLA